MGRAVSKGPRSGQPREEHQVPEHIRGTEAQRQVEDYRGANVQRDAAQGQQKGEEVQVHMNETDMVCAINGHEWQFSWQLSFMDGDWNVYHCKRCAESAGIEAELDGD